MFFFFVCDVWSSRSADFDVCRKHTARENKFALSKTHALSSFFPQRGNTRSHVCCSLVLCRHTLTLILRGEWPKLPPAAKTHFSHTLQKCSATLECSSQLQVQHPAASRCATLLALANNGPWTHPVLESILNGQPDSEHEEGKTRDVVIDATSIQL